MARLIAFGCSNTYGEGLVDCWDAIEKRPGNKPSQYAWPSVLGKLLRVDEVINLAMPGASNKRIWYNAISFDYQENDVVFLHWSFLERDCFFDSSLSSCIGPWNATTDKISRFYYSHLYTTLDRQLDFFNRADHINRYLTSKNIKHYNFQTVGLSRSGKTFLNSVTTQIPKWCEVKFLPLSMQPQEDIALDNSHPGLLSHRIFAEKVYAELINTKEI
jgi:hypothetical protein